MLIEIREFLHCFGVILATNDVLSVSILGETAGPLELLFGVMEQEEEEGEGEEEGKGVEFETQDGAMSPASEERQGVPSPQHLLQKVLLLLRH